jgi:hypothetical protein
MKAYQNDNVSFYIKNLTNNKIVYSDNYLPNNLTYGQSVVFSVNRIDTILSLGNNDLKIFIDSYIPDVNLANDTIVVSSILYPKESTSSLNAISCDQSSYTLPSGRTVSVSGTYLDTIPNYNGCDSIITLNLKIGNTQTRTIDSTFCEGNVYTSPGGKLCSITGTYKDTLTSVTGCDSIIISNITVNPVKINDLAITICEGNSYNGHNTTGNYIDIFKTYLGCDSTVNLDLTVKTITKDTIDVMICKGQIYNGYNTSGYYTDSLTSIFGCDSIVVTNLIVSDSVINSITKEICPGESYNGHSTTGTFRDVYQTTAGCDSIVYTQIVILSAPTVNLAGGLDTAEVQMPYFLVGGSSNDYSYLWSDNSTDRILVVDKGGQYKVTVTNPTTGCSTADSVFLRNKANVIFIEVTKVAGLVDTCYGITNTVSAEVKNVSGSEMSSGSEIKLDLLVNNILKKEGTITLVSNLPNNEVIVYNFGDISSKLNVGNNVIKVRTDIDGFTGDENSYKTDTIQIYSSTKPILAGGLNNVDFTDTYVLDAGASFASYLWNNNSINQTLTVFSSGTYWVHVTNSNGCVNGDTVVMNKKVGIESETMDEMVVYPNPVSTILKLKVPQCTENSFNLEIYSSDMRLVTNMKKQANNGLMEIDVANLKNGVYYIRIKSVECTYIKKFIKE